MKISQLFGNTLREPPADAEMTSHQLAVRAGLIRGLATGIYVYLPLGYRVVRRIEAILREEMEAIGAQEMLMPVLHPAELWEATGRWDSVGPALMRLRDRSGRPYALAMTHEEVVAALGKREIRSYRDLPRVVFHIQTKLRDEPRPRGGLMRVREFRMKDAYSLHTDAADLDRFYPEIVAAYERIFERCSLEVVSVEADTGMMGGADSHEFMLPHADGEDRLVHCSQCEYAANAERAEFRLPDVDTEPSQEVEPVETPGCATIADVAEFVGVPTRRTLKVVFYAWERSLKPPEPLMVLLRGDLEVNETKLMNLLGGGELRAATADEIRSVGGEPGYASPVGLTIRRSMDGVGEGVLVIADRSIQAGADFVAGANREGYHLTGVNYGRDFEVTVLTDIAQAQDGHLCPQCEGEMAMESAIELGHCFKLGTRYSEGLGVTYLDADGEEHPVVMGSYGIGVGRLLATIIEAHHDEYGIIWPPALAPFDVHLVSLARSEEEQSVADTVYDELQSAGLTVLYDDRDERAGVKFTDADLVGCPARVTVSRRSLESGGVELKARWAKERDVVPVDQLVSAVEEVLA